MAPWDFDQYTFEEFMLKRKGFYDHFEAGKKIDYQHFRIMTWYMLLPHIKPADAKKGIDKILPNIYDKEVKKVDKKEWLKSMQERARNIKLNRNARV
jgi:hypothetical protein